MMNPKLTTSSLYLGEVARCLEHFDNTAVEQIVDLLFDAYMLGRAVYIFGNGGSAALASHLACDLAKNVTFANGSRRLRALSLTDNFSLMSAWSNDVGYEFVFAEQLRNFIEPRDMVIAISGSGNSINVIRALELAIEVDAARIGITGRDGGKVAPLCSPCLIVPAWNMQVIEDLHMIAVHAIATILYNRISAVKTAHTLQAPRIARAASA